MTAQEAKQLDARVKADPSDVDSRVRLLGYYFMHQYDDPSARKARVPEILWLVHHRPADQFLSSPYAQIIGPRNPLDYVEVKRAWDAQVAAHPANPLVLGNAAAFVSMAGPSPAAKLLDRAATADPKNPEWPRRLGDLYSQQKIGASAEKQKQWAAKSLAAYEKAAELTTSPRDRFYLLDNLATEAVAAGDLVKADKYAKDDLAAAKRYPRDWNYGNAIHHGHIVLGTIALEKGDIKEACAQLLDAGRTPGSPQLDSFGPDFKLAAALLKKSQRDVVRQYLTLVGKFWSMGHKRLKRWTGDLDHGQTPDFSQLTD